MHNANVVIGELRVTAGQFDLGHVAAGAVGFRNRATLRDGQRRG
jgi:hypothetical protein